LKKIKKAFKREAINQEQGPKAHRSAARFSLLAIIPLAKAASNPLSKLR